MTFRNEKLGYAMWKFFGKIDNRIFCDLLLNWDSLLCIPCEATVEWNEKKKMIVIIYNDGIDTCCLSFPGKGEILLTKEDSQAMTNIISRYKTTLTKGIK